MEANEFIRNIRHLETSHPLPEDTPWDEVQTTYFNLCKKWFEALSDDVKQEVKTMLRFSGRVWGGTIF